MRRKLSGRVYILDWQGPPEKKKNNSEGFSHKRVRSESKYQQAPANQQGSKFSSTVSNLSNQPSSSQQVRKWISR